MLSVRIVFFIASACPVYPVEKLVENNIVKRQTILNSQERKSLVGHLQGLEGRTLVLTERQKLALSQELALREEGFGAFSPASDKEENVEAKVKQELPRNFQQFSNKDIKNSQDQFQTNFRSRSSSPTANQHPQVLLNQLPTDKKLLFQAQFNKLSQDLQEFSYNKFLSSSPEIQSYAIKQFLSLTPDQLAQSIKSEKVKETEVLFQPRRQSFSSAVKNPRFISQSLSSHTRTKEDLESDSARPFVTKEHASSLEIVSPAVPRFIDQPTSQITTRKEPELSNSVPSFPPQDLQSQVEKELQLFQEEASKADQLALQQQVEALKDIIAQQNKLNFSK